MKKVMGLLLSACAAWSLAADPASVDVKTYLDQLQVKLDHAAARLDPPSANGATSVTALRGSKQTTAALPLYWKGKETATPVTADEIKLFRSAVQQARDGKKTEAVATLKTFETTYPQSALKGDVEETLQRLQ